MSLNKFTVYCAHRSGSNFLEQLIIQNFNDIDSYQGKYSKPRWKHGLYFSKYKDNSVFNCLIARHPVKWVNGCVTFNADMWKWWGVDVPLEQNNDLCFTYKDRIISIPKMIDKWNRFYNEWLEKSDCYFVWYPDLLNHQTRTNILNSIGEKYNLERRHETYVIPNKVQHSNPQSNMKSNLELRVDYHLNLTDDQANYIMNNVDKDLMKKMNERRQYENSGDIQWGTKILCSSS